MMITSVSLFPGEMLPMHLVHFPLTMQVIKFEFKSWANVLTGVRNIYSCISTFPGEKPWCATQTDQNGDSTSGNWGTCGESCPGTTF